MVRGNRLLQKVVRAFLHRLHGFINRTVCGHDDDVRVGVCRARGAQDINTRAVRHTQICQDNSIWCACDFLRRRARVRRFFDRVAGLFQRQAKEEGVYRVKSGALDIAAGAGSGYLAGLVGIGGGIFLAPILHLTRWGTPRNIAATASLFILVNSAAGLAGQLMKLNAGGGGVVAILPYWPLFAAVLIGGQIGSFAAIRLLSQSLVRRATAILILYVAAQLLWRLAFG